MNPQDQDQNTQTPEGTLTDAGTPPVLESPSVAQPTPTPQDDSAALQAIDALEAEPVVAVTTPEATPPSTPTTFGVAATAEPTSTPIVPSEADTPSTHTEATPNAAAPIAGTQSSQSSTPSAAPFVADKKPSSKKAIVIILVIVLAIAAGAVGYFVYQSMSSTGTNDASETTTIEEQTGGDAPGGDDVPVEGTVNP